jgi:probable rRNA maturation factor
MRPVDIANRRARLSFDRSTLRAAIALLDLHAAEFRGGCPEGALSVAFLGDPALARLHARFLRDASPTDVITFGGDAAHRSAGEICVSVDAAARRCGRARASLSRELTLYVVHGWLHLAGYDDTRPAAKRAMRRAESRAMRLLVRSAAVPRFKLA